MLNRFINYISDNPFSGLGLWATGWVGSYLPELSFINQTTEQLRATHIFYFQMISLFLGTVVAILTIITLIQKISRNIKLSKK